MTAMRMMIPSNPTFRDGAGSTGAGLGAGVGDAAGDGLGDATDDRGHDDLDAGLRVAVGDDRDARDVAPRPVVIGDLGCHHVVLVGLDVRDVVADRERDGQTVVDRADLDPEQFARRRIDQDGSWHRRSMSA